jgi:hypothetical protein
VSGRVDQVDLVALPAHGRDRGRDRDPTVLLLGHPVHRRGAFVDRAEEALLAGREQDALRERRLAGIDVGDDPDVAQQRLGGRTHLLRLRTVGHREAPASGRGGPALGPRRSVGPRRVVQQVNFYQAKWL